MKKSKIAILAAAAAIFSSMVAGCASTPDPQAQLSAFCGVAQPEIAAFQAVQADLSPKAQDALSTAVPLVSTLCAPGVVASADNLQQFTASVLPALTIVAVEYAAAHK